MLFALAVLVFGGNVAVTEGAVAGTDNGTTPYCVKGTPHGVQPSVRVVVGITCCLSMIGAILIILSYVLIKDIRTKAREILLNLSLMDLMVAAANLIGILVNFDSYLEHSPSDSHEYRVLDNVCKAQAFFAMYGTISSILWTNCIAVFIFFHILLEGRLSSSLTMCSFYLLSYGLPLIVNVWFLVTGKLGYSPYGSSGWCSVIVYDSATKERFPLTLVFANDIWIYLTITLVPLIFISLKFHLNYQLQGHQAILTQSTASTVQKVEMKLIFIPIIFLLLRVWSLLLTIIEIEAGKSLSCRVLSFFIHLGGIGDSGQGFANAILFVLFTPKVRRYFLRLLLCHCLWRKPKPPVDIQGNTKLFYGTIPSNSEYRTECSDAASGAEGANMFLNNNSH